MKRVSLIIIGILSIISLVFYIKINNSYKKISNDYQKNIVSYKSSLDEYKKEYNDTIVKINSLSEIKINTTNEIQLIYNELNNNLEQSELNNEKLTERIASLKEQKKVLSEYYDKLVEEERKKRSYMISNVKTINQYSIGFPTGCESTALTILLNYYGVNVSVADVVNLLPKGDLPHSENGIIYGGNPYLEFIGHPTDPYSYGVYDLPIEDVANHFKPGIINGTGMSLNQVLELVRQGRPVIVWNTMNLAVPYINQTWIYKPTGETIKWLTSLHALVVIGYTEGEVIVSDSLNGKVRYFNKSTFEGRYNAFGKRALYY